MLLKKTKYQVGRQHHSGDTMDLAADGKDQEILFHKFNIILIFLFFYDSTRQCEIRPGAWKGC